MSVESQVSPIWTQRSKTTCCPFAVLQFQSPKTDTDSCTLLINEIPVCVGARGCRFCSYSMDNIWDGKNRARTGDGQLLFLYNHFIFWFSRLSFLQHFFNQFFSYKVFEGEMFGEQVIFLSSSGCFYSKALRQDRSAMWTPSIDLARQEGIGFHVKASKLKLNYHRLTHWHEHVHVSPGVSSSQIYIYI